MKRFRLILLILFMASQLANGQVLVYPAPAGSLLNADYSVRVRQVGEDWHSLPVYLANVANNTDNPGQMKSEKSAFAYFDFSGKTEVEVRTNHLQPKSVSIRPLAYSTFRIKGNVIAFMLNGPKNISVEVDGDIFHNLQLFAGPLPDTAPRLNDTSVVFFGPGIHEAGLIRIPSNKTVYIAGGAIVRGSFKMDHVGHVKICGSGIIEHGEPIDISFSHDIVVDGVIMLNPVHNSVEIGASEQVIIRGLKSFSAVGWGDGIDIFSSADVLIENVFMRNSDDCIAIYAHRKKYYGNTKNITIRNSVLWADVAHPLLIGTHGDPPHPDTISEIKVNDLDILDQHENQLDYQGCLALNAGDNNLLKNISFCNVRIGDIRKGQLINMRVMYNHKYNTAPGRGIEDVYFKNVSYQGCRADLSIIAGYDEDRAIRNVVFENLKINGTVISDRMPGKPGYYKTGDLANFFIGEHVTGIRFIQSKLSVTE